MPDAGRDRGARDNQVKCQACCEPGLAHELVLIELHMVELLTPAPAAIAVHRLRLVGHQADEPGWPTS